MKDTSINTVLSKPKLFIHLRKPLQLQGFFVEIVLRTRFS